MTIHFEKYHGLGNDYLVIEDPEGGGLPAEVVRRICNRSLGVGADGILLRGPEPPGVRFGLRILNSDGSEAEKSGNGLRIFARYLFDAGEVGEERFAVLTPGGEVVCQVKERGASVRVDMGSVRFESLREQIDVDGTRVEVSVANVGNPHCVVFRDVLQEDEVLRLGPRIESHPRFPDRTNVQLVRVVDRGRLAIEIWERGAGHTLASGSSSCAAAAVAHRLGLCDGEVVVEMRGGNLCVEIGEGGDVAQEGPVVHVASGTLQEEALA